MISFAEYLQAGADIVTIFGIIFGTTGLFLSVQSLQREKEKDRLEKEYGTFDDLDNKYVEFQYACAEHPEPDFFSEPLPRRMGGNRIAV